LNISFNNVLFYIRILITLLVIHHVLQIEMYSLRILHEVYSAVTINFIKHNFNVNVMCNFIRNFVAFNSFKVFHIAILVVTLLGRNIL
jgi:hypothetical protein